jgi:hypothetical protein
MHSHSIWAVLLAGVLALRMLLAPAHLAHAHPDHDHPQHSHADHPDHDEPSEEHSPSECKVCLDLFLTKHIGGDDAPRPIATYLRAVPADPAPSSRAHARAPFTRGRGPRAPPVPAARA